MMRTIMRNRYNLLIAAIAIGGLAFYFLSHDKGSAVLTRSTPSVDDVFFLKANRSIPLETNLSSEYEKFISTFKPSHSGVDVKSFYMALSKYSSVDKWIVLALADQGCVDMTISFFKTSIQRFNITNYLIIGSDYKTCDILSSYQINCYVYVVDEDSGKASVYHSKDFLRKMNIRTYMILDALRLGFSVLHTDVDIYYMRNPFEEFFYQSKGYDLAPLFDWSKYNAGFLFIRATESSIAVYKASSHIADTEPKTDDQIALNRAIGEVEKKIGVNVLKLPPEQYQCGKKYWDESNRNFLEDQACPACVVVHNNWIVSMEAKRYRFREIGMWQSDIDKYYSNPNTKYLTYDNEVVLNNSGKDDMEALRNALAIGEILNRTVILPKFHCKDKRCTILDHILLRNFEKHFKNYREHSFLQNSLVPSSVKSSVSDKNIIASVKYVAVSQRDKRPEQPNLVIYQPINTLKGASEGEIRKWFGSETHSVLRFDNLLGAFCCFTDKTKQNDFDRKVELGFTPGKYKQV